VNIGVHFKEADGTLFRYPSRVEPFELLLDFLPDEAWLILDLRPEYDSKRRSQLVRQAITAVVRRNRISRTVVCAAEADVLHIARSDVKIGGVFSYAPFPNAISEHADGIVLEISSLLDANQNLTPLAREIASAHAKGDLPFGALVFSENQLPYEILGIIKEQAFVWALGVESILDAATVVRPGRLWIEENWDESADAGEEVNKELWHLGYAKYNPEGYCHIYADNGIHIDIKSFDKPLSLPSIGEPIHDALNDLTEKSWDALKNWPFYSGGGAGFVPGIEGDFSVEVDVESAIAAQATMAEIAVVNVDPPANYNAWRRASPDKFVPNLPTSFRHKFSFFDPHGAPPFVGMEHDEDDGWRINWNLGTDYDGNRYGKSVGDGKILSGRIRLDRRGSFFAAYYRPTHKKGARDWICVGVARNDSLNHKVFLRLAGKRWRQENPAKPDEWMPVIPNHFVFRQLTLKRFS
jgi:hypothetical protein